MRNCRSTFVAALVLGIIPGASGAADSDRIYATWNPNDAGGLTFSPDNLTVSNSGRYWETARATLSMDSGVWYWETYYLYTPIGLPDIQTGLAWTNWSLSDPPGAFGSVARAVGTNRRGEILVGGQTYSSIQEVQDGAVVRHLFNADSGEYQVANGPGPWISATPFDGFFTRTPQFPTVSIIGAAGAGMVAANFGASPFAYDVPIGANPGVYVENVVFSDGFDGSQ